MTHHSKAWLAPLLAGVAWNCARLPAPTVGGALHRDSLPDSTSVPASWGNLVSVTVNPAFTDVPTLWFQDGTGRIHLVNYLADRNQLSQVSRVITRK
jgi:hypothetical protein